MIRKYYQIKQQKNVNILNTSLVDFQIATNYIRVDSSQNFILFLVNQYHLSNNNLPIILSTFKGVAQISSTITNILHKGKQGSTNPEVLQSKVRYNWVI